MAGIVKGILWGVGLGGVFGLFLGGGMSTIPAIALFNVAGAEKDSAVVTASGIVTAILAAVIVTGLWSVSLPATLNKASHAARVAYTATLGSTSLIATSGLTFAVLANW